MSPAVNQPSSVARPGAARNSSALAGDALPRALAPSATSLGAAWFRLVEQTVETGVCSDGECREILGPQVLFAAETEGDPFLQRFGDQKMIAEMDKVFFAEGANALGHSYATLLRGPDLRNDLSDVIALLRAEPHSKRAVATLCGAGHGKVPCINLIQFLVRGEAVRAIYFARGQDAFKKFYADALCLAKMTRHVAAALNRPAGNILGFLGSSHVYNQDLPAIADFLAGGKAFLQSQQP